MKEIGVGVIGCGYWGPNLVRNFIDNIHTDVVYACDLDAMRRERIQRRYPTIKTTRDYKQLLRDDRVTAVAIATPVKSHCKLVREAILAGKDVLVEKPMTLSIREAESVCELAEKKKRVVLVDHTFVYTGAVRKIKELIDGGSVGKLYYFDSVRVNLGLLRDDENVIWDLAPHDLSIMDYLVHDRPVWVHAVGKKHSVASLEDMAYITVEFKSSLVAHFHVNWLSPVKLRRIMIGGSKKMIVFDDLDPMDKVKVYDKGIMVNMDKKAVYKTRVQYRIGDMCAPNIESTEALKAEVAHFVDCIKSRGKPDTDAESGLRVVRLLDAANRSLEEGRRIRL